MAGELDDDLEFKNDARAARPAGDGMPQGNQPTPRISADQVEVDQDGAMGARFDDDAAASIVRRDWEESTAWLDENAWLAEWQAADYLYQSPNFDRGWMNSSGQAARISRFNVAKNTNTMKTQIRRGVFAEENPFVLEARGKLAAAPDSEDYINAITELMSVLSDRANFEYNMGLLIHSQCLQGTGLGDMGWEERAVVRVTRKQKAPPVTVPMPVGPPDTVHTWESDETVVRKETVMESWPFFEYRRLGTTVYDPKWCTPNHPELSAGFKHDCDYLNMQDLQQMREMECYKDIPDDEDLIKFFIQNPEGDAPPSTTVAQSMQADSSVVFHARGQEAQTSSNPFTRPFKRLKYSTRDYIIEVLEYMGRYKTIRNGPHDIGDYALGVSANWWDIDNSGYGLGIGRLNAGDQRMDQGVLNEVLKMIAFPMNAPILYDNSSGNAPTQNVVLGMGNFWGVDASRVNGDVSKAMQWMSDFPNVPKEAWQVYLEGKQGGEHLVGADAAMMQGQTGGPGSTALKTATGVNRLGSKADENVADPINNLEAVIERWLGFLWLMIQQKMPLREIREILSEKYGEEILSKINPDTLRNYKFTIKVLAGQKLAAKAAIAQLIPFLLQLTQQPQLLQYMHEKGWTINFLAIEKIFLRMSELQGAQNIIVPLTDQEKQMVQQMNPAAMKEQLIKLEQMLKGQSKLAEVEAKGKNEKELAVLRPAAEHMAEKMANQTEEPADREAQKLEGATQLEQAEARTTRNTDMTELAGGVPGVGE